MGHSTVFGRRRRERRYRAAWLTFLAHGTYVRLAPAEAVRVDQTAREFLRLLGADVPVLRRWGDWRLWAPWRAMAMHSLGIPPALDGETWGFAPTLSLLPHPRRTWLRRLFDHAAAKQWWRQSFDFVWSDPATAEALADLARRGLQVDVPSTLDAPVYDLARPGRRLTQRDLWREGGGQ